MFKGAGHERGGPAQLYRPLVKRGLHMVAVVGGLAGEAVVVVRFSFVPDRRLMWLAVCISSRGC